uniref:hypothetical protein n=1 Tax=Paractinoplanes polyasparticus TaxID=2856853 RepID=UPI001C859764|nr:hypothetical protein [Actinoplanes polyasparticus]
MNDKDTCGDSGCIDCNPSPAQLGDSMTVQPGEWTSIDDNGTEIWLYGDQAVDIVVRLPS